jgi:hypothetical protein
VSNIATSAVAVEFWPPRVERSTHGLLDVVDWVTDWPQGADQAARFMLGGVRVRTYNYGGQTSSGVWDAPWCLADDTAVPTPGGAKIGVRPSFPSPYQPVTPWASDSCDLTPDSQDEVLLHTQQWLKLTSPIDVERWFATRLLTDAGSLPATADFVTALGVIEAALGLTATQGYVHAGANVAAIAAANRCLVKAEPGSPWKWETPLGHAWVFGGGYSSMLVSGADSVLVATSKPYGWRTDPQLFNTVDQTDNLFYAVAEQSFCIGYEALVGAAVVTPA